MKQLLTSIAIVIASTSFSQEQESELVTDILYTTATISKEDAINYIKTTFEWERIETNDSCVYFKMEHGEFNICDLWSSFFFDSEEVYFDLWSELESVYGNPIKGEYDGGLAYEGFGGWFFLSTLEDNTYMLYMDRDILPVEE